MSRVLLVNPPFYRLLGSHYNGFSLGIAYIASTLNQAGYDAWVYNADYDSSLNYKTLYQIFEDFHGFEQKAIQECIESIVKFKPDWVGYSCYTALIPVLLEVTKEIRKQLPGVRQVIGGPHPTLDERTEECLTDVDFIVRGEGEKVMLSLLKGDIKDKTVQANRITNLDALPFPERKKFWAKSGQDISYISTARGCLWRCAYCASPSIWPRVYSRSPFNVLQEVKELDVRNIDVYQNNGDLHIKDNTCLYIIDDTFTFNEKRALEIIKGLQIPWKCEARADTITEKLAIAMAASGCKRVKMGIESGSDRVLASVGKGETKKEMRDGVRLLQKYNVPITLYLMAGFPGETDDDLRQTIAFARELKADYYSISMVAPYYGTRLYQDALKAGISVDKAPWECFFHHNSFMLLNSNLSRDLIEELWSLCDIKHYV